MRPGTAIIIVVGLGLTVGAVVLLTKQPEESKPAPPPAPPPSPLDSINGVFSAINGVVAGIQNTVDQITTRGGGGDTSDSVVLRAW